jgi:hypothetical protein
VNRIRAGLSWAWDAAQYAGLFVSGLATLLYSPALFSAIAESEPWLFVFYALAIPGAFNFRRILSRFRR